MKSAMVIVGGGRAGVCAAVALRENGWEGDIKLIGEESHLPYERPPLSKAAITTPGEVVPKVIHAPSVLEEHRISHIAGSRAVAIDRAAHTIRLDDGRNIGYERLLLAIGAKPRALPSRIADAHRVLSLRTFADALSIRSALRPGSRAIIVGGGLIGLELSASAVKRGVQVTLIEAAPRLLMRGVPASIAQLIESSHRRSGVEILMSAQIECVRGDSQGHILTLRDGRTLRADTVVAGIGAIPETEIAASAGLETENGISVDAHLVTTDPDILAAGDCCSFPHELYDGRRVRLEAWKNAQAQASVAAANMLGATRRYNTVPWFWSDQYDRTLQVVGLTDEGAREVERALPQNGAMVYQLSSEGRLVAASAFGRLLYVAKEIRVAEALIESRRALDPKRLADPAIALGSLLPSVA